MRLKLRDANSKIIVGSSVVVLANMLFGIPLLGIIAFGIWSVAAVLRISRSRPLLFGAVGLFSALSLLSVAGYLLFPFSGLLVAGIFAVLSMGILSLPFDPRPFSLPAFRRPTELKIFILLFQAILLTFLVLIRTDGPLVSPWMILPGMGFFCFCASVFCIVYLQQSERSYFFTITQVFLAVGVSAIVFGVGFGFDPFIHRAAEEALITTGHILPASILYSGQYALIGSLHYLTGLPVRLIDIWLLPILTSLFLPAAAYIGLRDGWKVREEVARMGWVTAFFLPFALFTFTVPFAFTYVGFVALLFLFPLVKERSWALILLFFTLILIFFHPLLAVPSFIFIVSTALYYRLPNPGAKFLVLSLLTLGVALAVPALLFLYQRGTGVAVDFYFLLDNLFTFLSLFANPFSSYDPNILWTYNLHYAFRYWQPIVLLFLSIPAFFALKRNRSEGRLLLAFMLGMFFLMYGVSTLFVYKNIIDHEQMEFALRLLQAFYLIPIPLIALFLDRIYEGRIARYVTLGALALLATSSWYFSYPQYNAKYPSYSPSVSADDIAVVHFMDERSAGEPYLVLSHQMTSAAALQEYGFYRYYKLKGENTLWYAIPTGGPLYSYYLSLITTGDRAPLQGLMEETGTAKIFLAMPSYWNWSQELLDKLADGADRVTRMNKEITIYEFDRYENADKDRDER
jgi:hypothetical protein